MKNIKEHASSTTYMGNCVLSQPNRLLLPDEKAVYAMS